MPIVEIVKFYKIAKISKTGNISKIAIFAPASLVSKLITKPLWKLIFFSDFFFSRFEAWKIESLPLFNQFVSNFYWPPNFWTRRKTTLFINIFLCFTPIAQNWIAVISQLSNLAQIFTSFLIFNTDHQNNSVFICWTPITQKLNLSHFSTNFAQIYNSSSVHNLAIRYAQLGPSNHGLDIYFNYLKL